MLKRLRILNDEPKSLDEIYFSEIRPRLYELHSEHTQYGSRQGRTLAEHLDSACQFVLTVSKIAEVPEQYRSCILAATAVHDLNKLDKKGRNVKTLARDRIFLREQLDLANVGSLIKTEEDLELVRKLIERHSGHTASDGMRFLPEDENVKCWAAMLIGGDLFDLKIDENLRIRKVETELTVAFSRPSKIFKITLSEDRGYLTALLLLACEEVLSQKGLNLLTVEPHQQMFEGSVFPTGDLTTEIAQRWQQKIDGVFSGNVEQLVKATKDGIKIDAQAIQQNPVAAIEQVEILLTRKVSGYKADKVAQDIIKYGGDAGEDAVGAAQLLGLTPVTTADEFAIAEGLKAAYLSYRAGKLSPTMAWDRIALYVGLSPEQRIALEPFNPQYGRGLFATKAIEPGIDRIRIAISDSFQLRQSDEEIDVSPEMISAVGRLLNFSTGWHGFSELTAYIEANPRQRCSLGATSTTVDELISDKMPPGTKVQVFSNRLPGGMSSEPKRRADILSALSYQLMTVGASFPKTNKEDPIYLHFSLPSGSSPKFRSIWQKWMNDRVASNAEGGTITFDELQLYRDDVLNLKPNKVVGMALPKRSEFSYSTVPIPTLWGDVNNSIALLKSLRLALEISLAPDFGLPFIISSNLEIEPDWSAFGRVEGIPAVLQPLLGSGVYHRQDSTKSNLTAAEVLNRLTCLGKLTIAVASLQKKDDCFYDLSRSTRRPLDLYYVLLRWILREQENPNLEAIWNRIRAPLYCLLESLMSKEHNLVSTYLKQAARLAAVAHLQGSSFRRTSQSEPFTEFISSVKSRKSHMDWDTVFASLVQEYHTRQDRINKSEYRIGKTKYEQIQQYYQVLRQLFDEVYHSRPEKLLTDSKTLGAAYLFFLQEARQELKDLKDLAESNTTTETTTK